MSIYAQTSENHAYLSTDFGEEMARRYFGDEIVDEMPRYVRGKRKGQLKGQICWTKVTRGGWVKTGAYDGEAGHGCGYVERRVGKVIEVHLQIPVWGCAPEDVAIWKWSEYDMNDRSKALCYKVAA